MFGERFYLQLGRLLEPFTRDSDHRNRRLHPNLTAYTASLYVDK